MNSGVAAQPARGLSQWHVPPNRKLLVAMGMQEQPGQKSSVPSGFVELSHGKILVFRPPLAVPKISVSRCLELLHVLPLSKQAVVK